jgi:hypothetical protein
MVSYRSTNYSDLLEWSSPTAYGATAQPLFAIGGRFFSGPLSSLKYLAGEMGEPLLIVRYADAPPQYDHVGREIPRPGYSLHPLPSAAEKAARRRKLAR